jgi:hypothetical protein
MDKQKWFDIISAILPFALSQVPKLAPIANEVVKAVKEAEQIFTEPGSGTDKLNHVVNVGVQAAQAVDELKGGPDDVAGPVSEIVHSTIPLVNALVRHVVK